MANLNFQQPPRSIASARTSAGFGGSSLPGHATPPAGMSGIFPPGGGNYGQSQQLSPNRNVQLSVGGGTGAGGGGGGGGGGSASSMQQLQSGARGSTIFGQRSFAERRIPGGLGGGSMSNMGSFMQSSRGGYGSGSGVGGGSSLNAFHSVFGGTAGESSAPAFDLSEFPSLSRGQNDQSLPQTNPLQPPGSKPYGNFLLSLGMVKQPTSEQSEFTMSNEDFPALPGTQITDGTSTSSGLTGSIESTDKGSVNVSGNSIGGIEIQSDSISSNDKAVKRGVQTSSDGKVTNIPASMVNNQFGMVGLLTFIRAAESDPNLVTLAMGQDLTGLGLNLNSQENLHPTFAGPFADQPCRAQDIEHNVPPEYLVNVAIRDKLASLTLKKYKDDLLFFLFYTNVGDVMQLAAAAELHSREWRYHIEEKVWITRIPGVNHYEKNGTKERGTFYFFDAQNWRRVPKEFQIDAEKLDKCPNLSALVSLNGQPV